MQALLQLREAHGEDKFKIIGGNTDRYLVTGERMPRQSGPESEAEFAELRESSHCLNAVFTWNLGKLDWTDYDLLRQIVGPGNCGKTCPATAASLASTRRPAMTKRSPCGRTVPTKKRPTRCWIVRGGWRSAGIRTWRWIAWSATGASSIPAAWGLSFGNPGAAEWALLEWHDGALTVDLRRVPYDVSAALRSWSALGYPEIDFIAQRLRS